MNEVKIFSNKQFGEVRTLEEQGKVYFCGKDVAEALGYALARKAIADHCKLSGVLKRNLIDNLGRKQQAKFIDEGNLYRLIAHSKLPSAEQFETWVFDDVLPTLRKTGNYNLKPTEDYKTQMLETRKENIRIRKANLLYKVSKDCKVESYREVLQSHITAMLTGEQLIPLPMSKRRTYSAAEVGGMLNISANRVGHLTNANGLKTEEYGEWVWDKSKYSAHECRTFRYYIDVVAKLKELLKEVA